MRWLIIFFALLPSFTQATTLQLKASCDIESANNLNFFSIVYVSDNLARVAVNTNQIYIITKEVDVTDDTSEFFFKNTDSVGLAGDNINWDYVSKDTPIFTLKKLNKRDYVINWYGFFDDSANKYIWSNAGREGVDLYSKSSILQNCDNY